MNSTSARSNDEQITLKSSRRRERAVFAPYYQTKRPPVTAVSSKLIVREIKLDAVPGPVADKRGANAQGLFRVIGAVTISRTN
jgi:hypothetical protein